MSGKKQMVINYVPGEECRVAIVQDGRLEEFHAERMDGPSNHVGNIYVGKVMNVEQSIQAAFIDFGLEQNGFLHTSDVHPQYFPGEENDKTERVGRKTPRRERPPIQDCFRRGDEVAVQVLKEGVGTKGPTVTSYLSIPGRFLVMMPQMDKVGVSRKVEDEETRRKMREILDQLDLPDGFGFILRTAGMERSKAELKRDLAYLMRLWKDMEKRWRSGSKPRLLYSESDLLVRALRDLLTSDIDEIVVDNEAALARAARFLKIVAPRTSTRVVHYTGKAPIFHVLGVEQQIQMIHAREVPLPSGGRLVIDETEALVAIDVNSGRSRDARDAESNAYQTNVEAVDEICRQLRLRDLGGVIVNDLIDMRSAKHRRDIETRFRDNLKQDRARWTIAPISDFGILEMTRQRMRASHESQHFTDCPTCRGRGLVQRPDSVAGDALRELAALLDTDGVARVEIVVHPRIAGELLSTSRRALGRIERTAGKHVDVRVSEAIQVDRVTFYAYDDRGADLDLSKLASRKPKEEELVAYEITSDAAEDEGNWAAEPEQAPEPEQYIDEATQAEEELHPIEMEPLSLSEIAAQDRQRQHGGQHGQQEQFADGEGGRRRRRRRRGRRGGRGGEGGAGGFDQQQPGFAPQGEYQEGNYDQSGEQPGEYQQGGYDHSGAPISSEQTADSYNVEDQEALVADPSHAVGEGSHHHETGFHQQGQQGQQGFGENGEQGQGGRRRRRRRRGRGGRGGPDGGQFQGQPGQPGMEQPQGDYQEGQYQEGGYDQQGEFAPQHAEGGESYGEQPAEGAGFAPSDDMGDQGEPEVGAPGTTEQGNFGPEGQQGFGPEGEGGRRRRRRRGRRGGRGGGGQFEGGQPGPEQRGGQPQRGSRQQSGDGMSLAAMFRSETPEPSEPQGGFEQPVDAAPEGGMDDAGPVEAPSEAIEGGDQGGEGGARRRGRRRGRRGGRGRGEGGGGDMNASDAPPARDEAPAPPPARTPPPAPPAASGANQPKIRTLYGSRRRIAPGQVKGPKREE